MKPHLRKYRDMTERLMVNSVLDLSRNCWIWTGRTTRDGYPLINLRVGQKHVTLRAHRVAFEELVGMKIGATMEINHTCHERRCINPDHLELATRQENLSNRRGYRACR